MNILVIKLSAIGDVVQTLPALEAIKRTYPESDITWVVEDAAADILDGHPLIGKLMVSRRKSWVRMLKNPLTFFHGLGSILWFFRELRRTRYDIAIDFQGLFKSGILIGLARAQRKIGFDRTRELSYLFLNERLPAFDIEKHALERYLDVARYLGAKDPSTTCTLPIGQELSRIKQKIDGLNPEGRALVAINPVARWKTKLWSERKFAELADRLISERNVTIIFTGSREDAPVNARILTMMQQRAVNWAGETTLKELAALAAFCAVFITTDTGPMHLAAAAGTKVVSLFGPTAPWRTGPFGPSHVTVRVGLVCSPCYKRTCDDNVRCMEEITVDEVMRMIAL